jgi:response regulator RpfG family c-di-GMP phosphodiesterase
MDQAVEAICDAAGTQFDPQVVAAFVQVIDESSRPVLLSC